jgi:hypothetical protein
MNRFDLIYRNAFNDELEKIGVNWGGLAKGVGTAGLKAIKGFGSGLKNIGQGAFGAARTASGAFLPNVSGETRLKTIGEAGKQMVGTLRQNPLTTAGLAGGAGLGIGLMSRKKQEAPQFNNYNM